MCMPWIPAMYSGQHRTLVGLSVIPTLFMDHLSAGALRYFMKENPLEHPMQVLFGG